LHISNFLHISLDLDISIRQFRHLKNFFSQSRQFQEIWHMTENSAVSWTTVVARGASKKVPLTPGRRNVDNAAVPLVGEVIFEDDDLKSELLVRKAAALVEQALCSSSVLFSFPGKLFGDRTGAYKVIEEQIDTNVDFRHISSMRANAGGDLLVEANFDAKDDATKAVNDGVVVNGVVYKAVSTSAASGSGSSVGGNLTHVQFNLLCCTPNRATFLVDMLDSLAFYGKVYQLKKYTHKGYFEGKMSVLIDTSVGMEGEDGEVVPPQPLTRMLYLSAWDMFAPAQFKNAPPVCHFCRLSGHVRKDCPELAKRTCFSCREKGHTARFCKVKKQAVKSFEAELDDYVALSGAKKSGLDPTPKDDVVVVEEAPIELVEQEGDSEPLVGVSGGISGVSGVASGVAGGVSGVSGVASGVAGGVSGGVPGDDSIIEVMELDGEGDPLLSGERVEYDPNSPTGARASKFADYEVASTMKVDTVQEMMDLSKVKVKTQNKIDFLKKNIVNVAKTKASASAIKTSKSSKSSSSAHRV
jgi:hypothetical protein